MNPKYLWDESEQIFYFNLIFRAFFKSTEYSIINGLTIRDKYKIGIGIQRLEGETKNPCAIFIFDAKPIEEL